nr:MAG: hypothetical protein [Molluscum contagiosum virus]
MEKSSKRRKRGNVSRVTASPASPGKKSQPLSSTVSLAK